MRKLLGVAMVAAAIIAAFTFWPKSAANKGADKRANGPVPVLVSVVAQREFIDAVEALGTALANESVDITANATDHVTGIHFHDGESVRAGQLLVELNSAEQQAAVAEAEINLAEQKRQLTRLRGTPTATARTLVEEKQSLVLAAEAQLDAARARLAERRIAAPFAGRLGLRAVSLGDLVSPGTLITTLDDLDTIKVDFSVPETFMAGLARGQSIEARTEALPGRVFTGRVSVVNTRVDPATRTVAMRAEIPNADHALRPGLLLSIRLIKNRKDSLAIPEAALVPIGSDQFVFVLESAKARRVQVHIGRRQDGQVEILDGLSAGQSVVTEGTIRLADGTPVEVMAAGTDPEA